MQSPSLHQPFTFSSSSHGRQRNWCLGRALLLALAFVGALTAHWQLSAQGHVIGRHHSDGSKTGVVSLSSGISASKPSPEHFADEVLKSAPNSLRPILSKVFHKPQLSYHDVFMISYTLLPSSTYNSWPSVNMPTPFQISETLGFNTEYQRDWYFYDVNGYFEDGSRFYLIRQMYRWGTEYLQGLDTRAFLFYDTVTLNVVDKNGKFMSMGTSETGPFYVHGSEPSPLPDDAYVMEKYPLRVTKGGLTSLEFNDKNGTLRTSFHGSNLSFTLEMVADKDVLLQGKGLNGLDPGSNQFISQITGATFLYYSWPSFKIQSGEVQMMGKQMRIDTQRPFTSWVDHQGGTVKDPSHPVVNQVAVMLGLRPSIFPGWNWFSVQFFSGEQFTGFSNKPWRNDKSFNQQQLQGTWDDKDGKLEWIQAALTITKFWTSPDSGIHFGIEYIVDLGAKGKFLLKAIAPDQRVIQWGTENYEGGADVFSHGDGKLIGFANVECVGWPDAEARVDFLLKSIGQEALCSEERARLASALKTDVRPVSIGIIVGTFLVVAVSSCLFSRCFLRKGYLLGCLWRRSVMVGIAFLVSSVIIMAFLAILLVLSKKVGCAIAHSCSQGKLNWCFWNCPT